MSQTTSRRRVPGYLAPTAASKAKKLGMSPETPLTQPARGSSTKYSSNSPRKHLVASPVKETNARAVSKAALENYRKAVERRPASNESSAGSLSSLNIAPRQFIDATDKADLAHLSMTMRPLNTRLKAETITVAKEIQATDTYSAENANSGRITQHGKSFTDDNGYDANNEFHSQSSYLSKDDDMEEYESVLDDPDSSVEELYRIMGKMRSMRKQTAQNELNIDRNDCKLFDNTEPESTHKFQSSIIRPIAPLSLTNEAPSSEPIKLQNSGPRERLIITPAESVTTLETIIEPSISLCEEPVSDPPTIITPSSSKGEKPANELSTIIKSTFLMSEEVINGLTDIEEAACSNGEETPSATSSFLRTSHSASEESLASQFTEDVQNKLLAEIDSLKAQLKQSEETQSEMSKYRKNFEDLWEKYADETRKKDELVADIERLKSDLETSTAKYAEMEGVISKLTEKNKMLKTEINHLKENPPPAPIDPIKSQREERQNEQIKAMYMALKTKLQIEQANAQAALSLFMTTRRDNAVLRFQLENLKAEKSQQSKICNSLSSLVTVPMQLDSDDELTSNSGINEIAPPRLSRKQLVQRSCRAIMD
ncbi:hypothetical protein CANCADRAFT_57490 [Tortispora caseinolytica NRRL Y-17796]|uniref:Uncharacterized protein n=1 Tax=Tortispora caseinolytica NRRL Y-17796 TaxID=767744 RepID=A0A1E4THL0_9ASCO|nr:hypothetical protein CANCADRAFT_57490 [Tortispora caseinolytica NRRL Y-17796]